MNDVVDVGGKIGSCEWGLQLVIGEARLPIVWTHAFIILAPDVPSGQTPLGTGTIRRRFQALLSLRSCFGLLAHGVHAERNSFR